MQGRHFFDLSDTGNKILQKLNADIVIWGYQEDANIRLNFQTANAYSDWDNVSCSILDSLYIPAEHFEHINFFPEMLTNLITGVIASAISEQRIDLRHLKRTCDVISIRCLSSLAKETLDISKYLEQKSS